MSEVDRDLEWAQANQALLSAEFARLKALVSNESPEEAEHSIEACRQRLDSGPAIDHVAALFDLSAFERDILLLSAGVEMDSGLAALCEQVGHHYRATFGIALATLPEAHWSALTPVRSLRRWRLINVDDREGLAGAALRIDERVLHYLAGINYLDVRLRPLMRKLVPAAAMAVSHESIVDDILAMLRAPVATDIAFQLHGDDPDGQADIAAAVAAGLGMPLHAVRADDLPQTAAELDAFVLLWQREAALLGSALLIEVEERGQFEAASRLVQQLDSLCFLVSREPVRLGRSIPAWRVDKPDAAAQRDLWQAALGPTVGQLNGSLSAVATQFRFSTRSILAEGQRLRERMKHAADPDALLWQDCRDLARSRLDDLAQQVTPEADWNDLVLPEAQLAQLHQIAAQVRQRLKVHQDWGFAANGQRGLGIAALFAGDSGTGKTLAAEVLANALRLDLYRIDLASVVSKYIGETEKNLKRVFDAGEDSGAILLFDEADALFGKRSEVKDSHDRYANIEVSYLLQRMEDYSGLAILTTNHKTALDQAFQRRLRFVVHFPFPNHVQRKRIWRGIFPDRLPREKIDYEKLARLNVAGGTIRNIALTSAFLAAEANEPVGMKQLLRGARLEAAKRNRAFSDAETRGWV